jgi:DNA processing protein
MTDKLLAWLCLKSAPELGQKGTLELLKLYPDPTLFVGNLNHELYSNHKLKPATREHLLCGEPGKNQKRSISILEEYGIGFYTLSDPQYPAALKATSNPPLILYFLGEPEKALEGMNLAVVGTRKPTTYGVQMCHKLLAPLCEKGVSITSGLAMGIDTIAHQTALAAGSKTLAVLASGLEQIYPPMNKILADRIVQNGALISEYEPGSKLERWNFPDRNRIISALAKAVFIVEGAKDSGAMLTAKFAKEQNKPLFALPGNINNRNAEGPNLLIRNGANLISSPSDLIKDLGLENEQEQQLEIVPVLNAEEQVIFDLLATEQREMSFDELMLKTGFGFGKLSSVLLSLELNGTIAKSGGNCYQKI